MIRLDDEYGCKTLEEAKRRAAKLEKAAAEAEKKFNRELEEFEGEFGSLLL